MLLYSISFPAITGNNESVSKGRFDNFEKYIGSKIGFNGFVSCKLSTIIDRPEVKYAIQWDYMRLKDLNEGEERLINHIVDVIHEIDKELKDRFNIKY
jgi:RNAse (barnase) inhibitor barstar